MTSSTKADPKKGKQDDPEQYKRFLEAAKKAEADETAKGADKAFRSVVKPRKPQK
jgi:hypothetical protein